MNKRPEFFNCKVNRTGPDLVAVPQYTTVGGCCIANLEPERPQMKDMAEGTWAAIEATKRHKTRDHLPRIVLGRLRHFLSLVSCMATSY